MNSSYENLTSINLINVIPGVFDFVIYFVAAVFGTITNVLLIYAIHINLGHFGQRPTFTYLVKYLCIIDLILCILIPVDLVIITQIRNLAYYEIFSHPRNMILTAESFVLLFISIDRFVAIKMPFSTRWNCYSVCRILLALVVLLLIVDVAIVIQTYCCSRLMQLYGLFFYIVFYIGVLLLILCLTYIFYFLVFVSFYRHAQYMNSNIPMRHIGNNSSAGGEHKVGDAEETPLDSTVEDNSKTYLRLARVLISVTLVYTVSIIPHLLIGIELIEFQGYMFYNLFYLNAVVNPIILLITDAKLRKDIKERFQRKNVPAHQQQLGMSCPVHTSYD